MTRVAALTGATGFLGAEVARQLVAAGWQVRALTRRWPERVGDLGLDLVPGDLADTGALDRLIRDVTAVIHVAGAIKGRPETLERVNVAGTAALVAAWRHLAPDAPFVHVSSMAARMPGLSPYAASKRAGEDVLREEDGPWRIRRPAAIYGPGDLETLKIFKLMNGPVQPLLNGPDARVAMVHVEDAAREIVAALEHDAPQGPLEITDARVDGYTWREIVGAATAALARPMRPVAVPPPVLRLVGLAGDVLSRLGLSDEAPSSAKISELLHLDWSAHAPAAARNQDYIGIEDGFRLTVSAYRAAGRL